LSVFVPKEAIPVPKKIRILWLEIISTLHHGQSMELGVVDCIGISGRRFLFLLDSLMDFMRCDS
jgi:hypothetical protein